MSVEPTALPGHALLQNYARNGSYADCFTTVAGKPVTFAQYVSAFYCTWLFKLERWILKWAISLPSTDDEARQLASGQLDRFSAWRVEGRADNQLLMRDEFTRRTCSWLMSEPLAAGGTRLYFGSAVVPKGDGKMGRNFISLLWFHKLYSRMLLAAAAAALAGCVAAPTPLAATKFTLSPCQQRDVQAPLLCGNLAVPENRDRPEVRAIKLNVVVVPASGEKTLPPLYYLEGGPGLPATGSVSFWAEDGAIHRQHRDIVLVDQRGTGGSGALACALNFSNPLEPVLGEDAGRACRYQLQQRADLTQYTTAAAVADLEAVREALGQQKIDLIGLSYGTRLAQEYARAHPDRVRAMALLGTLSPQEKLPLSFSQNAHDVLMRLAKQCEADAKCRRAVPKATADIAALRAKFAKGPVSVKLADGKAAKLEAGPFWEGVRAQLTTTPSQRRLPWLLHEAAQGRFGPILAAMPTAPDNAANGLLMAVSCPEDTLHITEDELAPLRQTVFGDYRARRQIAACRVWPGEPLPRTFSFVTGDAPTLLMAGGMDHVTPPQWAQDVATGMVNARVVVVPDLGHFPDGLSNMECYDQVIAAFFEAGSAVGLDLSCIATMKASPFEASGKP